MSGTGRHRHADRHFVLGAVAACLLLYVPALVTPLLPDEAGYWLVARHWDPQPDNMFGFYWTDRPPVLLWMYQAADLLGGPFMPRIWTALLGCLTVVAAFRATWIIGGPTAARWSTVATVALLGNPAWFAWAAKGESLGVPLVMVSCWLALESLQRPPGRARLALALSAGAAGMIALGMKQNLASGLVFGAVLLAVSTLRRQLRPREAARLAGAALTGALVPLGVVLVWAVLNGVDFSTLWEMIYGFRSDAFEVITRGHMSAPLERAFHLIVLFVGSGLALLIVLFLASFRRALTVRPAVAAAVLSMIVVDVAGIVLGGSYWMPYLIALIPAAVLSTAVVLTGGALGPPLRATVAFAVVSTTVLLAFFGYTHVSGRSASPLATYRGEAVGEVAHPDDTILVLYGAPEAVRASGLDSPYPYLWSLPIRTLDPELDQMLATMRGPDAPVWVVQRGTLDPWGLDDTQLRDLLHRRYDNLGKVCQNRIWRLKGETRPPLPTVDCTLPYLRIGPVRLTTQPAGRDG
jgi:hypothetical protein